MKACISSKLCSHYCGDQSCAHYIFRKQGWSHCVVQEKETFKLKFLDGMLSHEVLDERPHLVVEYEGNVGSDEKDPLIEGEIEESIREGIPHICEEDEKMERLISGWMSLQTPNSRLVCAPPVLNGSMCMKTTSDGLSVKMFHCLNFAIQTCLIICKLLPNIYSLEAYEYAVLAQVQNQDFLFKKMCKKLLENILFPTCIFFSKMSKKLLIFSSFFRPITNIKGNFNYWGVHLLHI